MYSEENFWLKKTSQSTTSSKKKKEGKSETVRRMRKYEKTRNGERYKARGENLICGPCSVNFLRMMKKRAETQPLSPVNYFNDLHETIYHILD